MFASIYRAFLCCILATSGCHGFVRRCEDLDVSDSKQCAFLKDVTRATAEVCSKQANSFFQLCKDTEDKKDQSHQCSCFTKSQFFVCEKFFDTKSLKYYDCLHFEEHEKHLQSKTTSQIRSLCKEDLEFFKVAQDACDNKTSTDFTLPACEILPDNPDTLTCNELPAYLELAKTCKPKLPRYTDAQKACAEKFTGRPSSSSTTTTTTTASSSSTTTTTKKKTTSAAATTTAAATTSARTITLKTPETTKSTTTLTTTADPTTTKRTAPSTSAQPKTTTASTICTPGEQNCISIKFHKTCQTADPKNDESVTVLANGKCNRIGTEDYRYYTLECGGDGIAGVFNCDSTCQNCQVEKLDVALDGQCITKPYGPRSSDISLAFNGMCETTSTTTELANEEFTQTLIIFVTAPVFLAVVIFTALLIAYLLCNYSKPDRDLVSADSCASVEVIATMVDAPNNVQNSSSSSSSEGRSSLEGSHLQGRGGILIDEYGIPLDESSTSSEIMARIPPSVFSARKKQWMRVMTEYSIPANKAAAWARDYDDVHTLVASVEHGNLNGSVLAARLHECDSAFTTQARSRGRNAAAEIVPLVAQASSGSGSSSNRNPSNSKRPSADSHRRSGDSNRRSGDSVRRSASDSVRRSAGSNRQSAGSNRQSAGSNKQSSGSNRQSAAPNRQSAGSNRRSGDSNIRSGDANRPSGDANRPSGDANRPSTIRNRPPQSPPRPIAAHRKSNSLMANSSSSASRKSSYTSVSTGPPPAVANTAFITARKREWIRVMLENNVNRSKAEALAREHSRVDELAESVENGTLSDGALASLLHHRDAAFLKSAKSLLPISMRAPSAASVPLIPPSSTAYTAFSVVQTRQDPDSKASASALRDAPVLKNGNVAKGQCGHDTYKGISLLGKGGFGEIYQGFSSRTQEPFALKRQMVVQEADANVHDPRKLLQLQLKRMRGLMRETAIYFSSTLNVATSRHLARIHDVVLVANSAGSNEPLLVFEYADAPKYNTLSAWVKHYPNVGTGPDDLKMRLSFAIQMFSGLWELHYGSPVERLHEQQQWAQVLQSVMPPETAQQLVAGKQSIHQVLDALGSHYHKGKIPQSLADALRAVPVQPLYAHQDMKGANMLLFGRGHSTRLALTDFGLTAQYNGIHVPAIHGGTLKYMAPEQWQQQSAFTPKRDIWSAGLILAQIFGGRSTKAKLKTYQSFCQKSSTNLAQCVRHLTQHANAIANAMMLDAREFPWRKSLSILLQRCLVQESERYTAFQCKDALVRVWSELFPSTPWEKYEKNLKPPKIAPCAAEWNGYDREAMSYTISRHMMNLMLERCEEAARIAPADFGTTIRQAQKELRDQLNNITLLELSCSAKSRQVRWNADSDNS